MSRVNYLPLSAFILLDNACVLIREAFGSFPYLVGSSQTRPDWRDVDVRLILGDDEYDGLFASRPALWSLFCLSISEHLSRVSGLPIDFQVQRMTQANDEYSGMRNPLGTGRQYAGGMPADTRI